MKKLLSTLMLFAASLLLALAVVPSTYALEDHTIEFTLTVSDGTGTVDIDLYDELQDAVWGYPNLEILNHIEVYTDDLVYETAAFIKNSPTQYRIHFEDDEEMYYTILIYDDETIDLSDGDLMFSNGTYDIVLTITGYFEADYDDLFYDEHVVNFTATKSGTTTVFDATPEEIAYIHENRDYLFDLTTSPSEITIITNSDTGVIQYNSYITPVTTYYTGYRINLTVISGTNNSMGSINLSQFVAGEVVPVTSLQLSGGGVFYLDHDEVTFVLTFRIHKPWTQAYSHGRYRTSSEETYYLNHEIDGSTLSGGSLTTVGAYFSTINASQRVFNANAFAPGETVTIQSPYKNFKIEWGASGSRTTLIDVEDVAAVQIHRLNTGTAMAVRVWHWVDGDLEYQEVHTGLFFSNVTTTNILFYGGYRQAISTEETFVANVDNLVPLEDFLEYVFAWDDIDGDISDQVYIDDDGDYQPDVVGIYEVVFAVADSEGNISTLEAAVHVVDIVAPVISGTTTPVVISYHEDFNVAAWVASLTVSDNYYTGLSISIQTNTYSSNKTTLGNYSITVQATDPSGNTGTLTRNIQVVDGIGPVFTGITTISASINENLTMEQIKASLAAIDAKDGNVTSSITVDSDELTGNSQTPGVYLIVFMAEDSAGNQTFHEVTASIHSEPPGILVLNGTSVRLLPGATLTIEQILGVLGITEDYSDVSTNYNPNIPGTYHLSFTFDNEEFSIDITVLGLNDPIIPLPAVPGEDAEADYSWVRWTVGVIIFALLGFLVIKKKK